MIEEDDDARIVSSDPLTGRIRPMTAASEFKLATRWILRVVPDTRGNWLFGTKLFRAIRDARLARLSLHHSDFHSELRLDLSDPAQFTMVKRGRFDLMTAAVVCSALKSGDTFVDVGANWGYFTSIASHRVGLGGLERIFRRGRGSEIFRRAAYPRLRSVREVARQKGSGDRLRDRDRFDQLFPCRSRRDGRRAVRG